MNIIVCIKQVPAKDAPLAIAGNWIKESDIGFEMNEPDTYALEEALRLKEKHGGEVIALSLGPERVKQTIKEALAKGADRGIHIADDNFAQLDPLGSAKCWPRRLPTQKCDLVLTGLQSDDHGFGQTGVLLAGLLNLAARHHHHANRSAGRQIEAETRIGSGLVPVDRMPAARGALHSVWHQQSALRHAEGHHGREEKGNRTVATRESLGVTIEPTQKIEKIYVPTKTKKTEFLTGTPKEAAAKLVEKLKFEARVI